MRSAGFNEVRDFDGVSIIVDFHGVHGRRELPIIVATPAGHLRAFESSKSLWVTTMNSVGSSPHSKRKSDVHPGFEVHPRRHGPHRP